MWPGPAIAPRLGIAARLSIAFGAVALLAVAANAISEHGAQIIRTINRVPVIAPSAQERLAVDALPVALERFQRAVLARVDSNEKASAKARREATAALTSAADAYVSALEGTVDDASEENIVSQVAAHEREAAALVRAADARRGMFVEFDAVLATLDARIQSSLNRVVKIFGKVVARGYLVDAERILEELRPLAAGFAAPTGYDRGTVDAMASKEQALASILRDNERGIVRALGSDWLAETRGDLEDAQALRESLVRADNKRAAALEAFARNQALLAAQVREATTAFAAASAVATDRRHSANALSAISAEEHRQRTLLKWMSVCVLALLLAVSVNTVMSVVMPVRRLVKATRRLAQGESDARVPRGGIRELDTLAVSFNRMAEELAAAQALARQYHAQLEEKVEQRTRQLQHLAEHDPLTRLPNRRHLFTRLNSALERAAESQSLVGVLFLDLDHFKNINDSMGHVFGDRVLQTIAERLRGAVGELGFTARLGGDEFTVVFERAAHIDEIRRAGNTLVRAFQDPLIVDGRELLMGLSVGASVYPTDAADAEALLRAADAALFQAKAQGRSRVTMFSPDLLATAESRFATEQGLRRAVERGEFELFFQPEVRLATFETGVAEALLRWRLPNGVCAPPQDFLQVAEDCGLIREIGDWVLRSAVEHAARWHRKAWPDVRVAVNVSSRQLIDGHFVDRLRELLSRHRLPPQCIEIELTENVLQTGRHTIEALRELRAIGVGVALDDFGTGYSSLVSLEQLPLSRVKLDRSLIASIDSSARSQAIAQAIIALCHSLSLEVTAEGIERTEQLTWLRDHADMYLQGFLLSPPVPGGELLSVIADIGPRMRPHRQAEAPENAIDLDKRRKMRLRRAR